jgi:uncharacterized protein (TIGR02466 family)
MQYEIKKWFGNPIFITKLDNHQTINKDIKLLINKEVKPTNSQFAKTTDIKDDIPLQSITDNLHTNAQFAPLFKEIKSKLILFLTEHHYDLSAFEVHITKAWATNSVKGQHIASHKHTASHFSLVYYVQAEEQGNITFEEDQWQKTGMYIPPNENYYTKWSEINFASIQYPSETGGLIIFPSNLLHYTQENTTNEPRISISADVLLTMKTGVKSEHCLPSPETWSKVC